MPGGGREGEEVWTYAKRMEVLVFIEKNKREASKHQEAISRLIQMKSQTKCTSENDVPLNDIAKYK